MLNGDILTAGLGQVQDMVNNPGCEFIQGFGIISARILNPPYRKKLLQ
jgi:hypothetical protein